MADSHFKVVATPLVIHMTGGKSEISEELNEV